MNGLYRIPALLLFFLVAESRRWDTGADESETFSIGIGSLPEKGMKEERDVGSLRRKNLAKALSQKSDTPRKAGGLMSRAASKAVGRLT